MIGASSVPVGTVVVWCGSSGRVPLGWLYCNGSVYDQSVYPDLFDVIGHSFGNPEPSDRYDPSKQFFVPDFRGYFLRGVDDGAGRDPDADKRYDMQDEDRTYKSVGSCQQHEFEAHSHPYTQFPNGRGNIAAGRYWQSGAADTGSTGGKETRPVNAAVFYIIRALA